MTEPTNTNASIDRHLEIVLLIKAAYIFKFGTAANDQTVTALFATWEIACEDILDDNLPALRRKAIKTGRCGTLSDVLEIYGLMVSERNKVTQEARENEIYEAKRTRHMTPELLTDRQKQLLADDNRGVML